MQQCPDCPERIDVARLASREPEDMTRDELIAEVNYLRVRVEQLMEEPHAD